MSLNHQNKTMDKLSKSKKIQQEVLKALDAEDESIAPNPGVFSNLKASESFETLFESDMKNSIQSGDVVKGKIVSIHKDFVLVDINYKSEGMIDISEFRTIEGRRQVEVGQEVEVYIDKVENENGVVVLSKDKADMLQAWNDISRAVESGELVEGTVLSKVKGGLSVDIGVKAFLPGSQIDFRPVRNLDTYLGKTFKFKVIKFNKKRGNIVLSRRATLEAERETMKTKTLDMVKSGEVVTGLIKNITDYGAFIDLGGMDGLLHITDMSWGRVKHPSELLQVGQKIDVKILRYDEDKERVSLGLKQLEPNPWSDVIEKYPIGKKLQGKIVNLTEYGAFVELDEGIEGLIHVSEMSWTKRVKHPSQLLKEGDTVDVQVLEVDTENRRISLGMKQLQPNPWVELKENYSPGTIIEGEVKSITEFGIFVSVEQGVDGLVHISDFSWTKRINHPSEMFKKGDQIKAVVLGVDIENEKFSLGIKQLEADPWSDVETKYAIGTQHEVKVVKLTDFGVFVELEPEVEGLIHISELTTGRVEKVEDFCKEGSFLKAEVVTIDTKARKIGLSSKLVKLREEKGDVEDYVKKATTTSKTSLGELFGETLQQSTQTETKITKPSS